MSEVWSKWQGYVVNDTFPLRRYLGSSDHSGVFLTELAGREPTEVAIKLLRVMPHLVESYRLQWEQAATLEHPQLIRLLETGQCQLEGQPYLYLVMEYADQTLAQLLEHRALAEDEAREMLLPVLDTLAFLHNRNLVQGQLKPANILVVGDQLRLASDTIRGVSEAAASINMVSVYDPPEIHDGTVSTAGDMWALGITLYEALTRSPPIGLDVRRESVGLPGQFSPMFRDIVGGCLSRRTFDRPKAAELAARLRGEGAAALAASAATADAAGVAGVAVEPSELPAPSSARDGGSSVAESAASVNAGGDFSTVASDWSAPGRVASVTVSAPTSTIAAQGASNAAPDVGAAGRVASAAAASVSTATAAAARVAGAPGPTRAAPTPAQTPRTSAAVASAGIAPASQAAAAGAPLSASAAPVGAQRAVTESTGTHRALMPGSESTRAHRDVTAPGGSAGAHRPAAASTSSTGTHRALTSPSLSESTGTHRAVTAPPGLAGAHRPSNAQAGSAGTHRAVTASTASSTGTHRALATAPELTGAHQALQEGHRPGTPPAAPSASTLAAAAARLASGAQTGAARVPSPATSGANVVNRPAGAPTSASTDAAAARAASTSRSDASGAHRATPIPSSTGAAAVARTGAAAPGGSSATQRPTSSAVRAAASSVQAGAVATPDPAKAQRPPPKPIVIEHFTPESLMPEMAQRPATNSGQPAASAPRSTAAGASSPPDTAATPSNGASFHAPSSHAETSYTTWSEAAATTAALNAADSGAAVADTEQQPSLPRSLLPVALGAVILLALGVTTVYILRSRANTTPPVIESYQDAPLPSSSDPPPEAPALPVSASPTAAQPVNAAPRPVPPSAPAAAPTAAPAVQAAQTQAAAPTPGMHEEIPEVPPRVLQTIRGHVRVSVRLIVDKEGTVFAALIDEPGPSRYFEHLAIEAAKKWTFPPLDTTASRLELVRFEFTRQGATGRAIEIE